MLCCFLKSEFKHNYLEILNKSDLTQDKIDLIERRYVNIVVSTEHKNMQTDFLFYLFTNVITIAGILIASLVSLEKANTIKNTTVIFWLVWSMSIASAMANKWIYAFNIHKKHVLNNTVLEKLYTEGWCFLSKIGRYTHKNIDDRFMAFMTRIEKLKLKYAESLAGMESDGGAQDIFITTPRGTSTLDTRRIMTSRESPKNVIVKNDDPVIIEIPARPVPSTPPIPHYEPSAAIPIQDQAAGPGPLGVSMRPFMSTSACIDDKEMGGPLDEILIRHGTKGTDSPPIKKLKLDGIRATGSGNLSRQGSGFNAGPQ